MNITETETSAGISSAVPENPIKIVDVYNGENTVNLKETTLRRLQLRKQLNENLFENIDNKNPISEKTLYLTESVFDAAKSWILFEKQEEEKKGRNSPRYKLQDWTNGGGGDDTEKGQPSAYESWRRSIVDRKRKARLEQELQDETSPYKSPTNTDVSSPTLDNQEDAFLSWWISKHGGK